MRRAGIVRLANGGFCTVPFSLTFVSIHVTIPRMIHQFWRLTEGGGDNLGPAITGDGLVLGRTPLIERRGGRFVVRERAKIERLLKRAHLAEPMIDRLLPGLTTVASALNANDPCWARIAAVHLKIPDLPNFDARDELEAEDVLIKLAARQRPAVEQGHEIRKASPDDPKHPGWPKGTEGGRGGQFRPKDGSEIAPEIKARLIRITARRALRISALKLLRFSAEAAANLVPILDVAADAALVLDIADTVSQFWKLATDVTAALDFAKQGPHSFEDLQVSSSNYEEFSSYRDFIKGDLTEEAMVKRFGGAGDGCQYHHIVTQGGANVDNIPAEQLQNTDNIIRLPTLLHEVVNGAYLGRSPVEGMNMYQWLQTQPYDVQREEGLKILRQLDILK